MLVLLRSLFNVRVLDFLQVNIVLIVIIVIIVSRCRLWHRHLTLGKEESTIGLCKLSGLVWSNFTSCNCFNVYTLALGILLSFLGFPLL